MVTVSQILPNPHRGCSSVSNQGGAVGFSPLTCGLTCACCRAVGCIFGELLNNSPLFPGENDIEQLCCVLRVLGTPNQKVWPVSFFHPQSLYGFSFFF